VLFLETGFFHCWSSILFCFLFFASASNCCVFFLPSLESCSSINFCLWGDPLTKDAVPWCTHCSELFPWIYPAGTGLTLVGNTNELWALLGSSCSISPTVNSHLVSVSTCRKISPFCETHWQLLLPCHYYLGVTFKPALYFLWIISLQRLHECNTERMHMLHAVRRQILYWKPIILGQIYNSDVDMQVMSIQDRNHWVCSWRFDSGNETW
jgi:hypothetical protein